MSSCVITLHSFSSVLTFYYTGNPTKKTLLPIANPA
nr:MAG TPA: hypothetical protein [Caudoviricetes sp.]